MKEEKKIALKLDNLMQTEIKLDSKIASNECSKILNFGKLRIQRKTLEFPWRSPFVYAHFSSFSENILFDGIFSVFRFYFLFDILNFLSMTLIIGFIFQT